MKDGRRGEKITQRHGETEGQRGSGLFWGTKGAKGERERVGCGRDDFKRGGNGGGEARRMIWNFDCRRLQSIAVEGKRGRGEEGRAA